MIVTLFSRQMDKFPMTHKAAGLDMQKTLIQQPTCACFSLSAPLWSLCFIEEVSSVQNLEDKCEIP